MAAGSALAGAASPEPRSAARPRDPLIACWLLACCALVFCMVVVGGVTRLSGSGLSMVEWNPIMGVLPPLTDAQWQETFDAYRQSPEYHHVNRGMDLAAFQGIFWMEYIHRLLGRAIGVAFIVPFLFLLVRRRIPARLTPRLLAMFALGAAQGLLGWYMVRSGLVDVPHVSQYRLVAHLLLAVAIYAYMLWTALDLLRPGSAPPGAGSARAWGGAALLGVVVMIASGGFVAGTRAGFVFNTFPTMGGEWLPPGLLSLEPAWRNFFDNVVTVQLVHRVLALAMVVLVVIAWRKARGVPGAPFAHRAGALVLAALALQVGLGIATLLMRVPLSLAAAHQAGAMVLLTALLALNHGLRARAVAQG